jgi:hypothetical protein
VTDVFFFSFDAFRMFFSPLIPLTVRSTSGAQALYENTPSLRNIRFLFLREKNGIGNFRRNNVDRIILHQDKSP